MTDTTTVDDTAQVDSDVTSDNTGQQEEVQELDLGTVGQDFQESKRVQKLSLKEANRYKACVDEDGEIDYQEISKIYRGNKVSDKALEMFCEENGFDIEDIKLNIEDPYNKVRELEARLAKVETQKVQEEGFTDILRSELSLRGIANKEFAQYKAEFESELQDLSGLDDRIAISKALDLSIGRKPKQVKVVRSDATTTKSTTSTLTRDQFDNFMNNRSRIVGDAKAAAEFEAYCAKQEALGLPLYK